MLRKQGFLLWHTFFGGLAQLARASALHAEGQRFDSVILHIWKEDNDMLEADRFNDVKNGPGKARDKDKRNE